MDKEARMPKYRISAEIQTGRKTVAYRTSKGTFGAHSGDAQQVTLTPKEGRDWLNYTWYHFKRGWAKIDKDPIWKRHGLDQVRLVLEEIDGQDTTVIDTTADWDSMTVTSGGATS